MGLKDELQKEVKATFEAGWTTREGTVVPSDDSIKLGNDAVDLEATVLYADMADSTKLVDGYKNWFAAEIYKAFLYSAAKIVREEGGAITAYDGDRIMAVFIEGAKNTAAVRAGMKIKWAVDEIINPARLAKYTTNSYVVKHVVGIDTSKLYIARTGVRGANDLVWVGRAANYAAKLSALPEAYTYITKTVYDSMLDEVKFSNNGTGTNMWEAVTWNTFDNSTIYRSHWRWTLD
jgi:class 3 adenylate cyclase